MSTYELNQKRNRGGEEGRGTKRVRGKGGLGGGVDNECDFKKIAGALFVVTDTRESV